MDKYFFTTEKYARKTLTKIDGNKLQWKWNPKKEYAECYNLAETEIEIKIRTKRGAPDEFSISMDTHDILRTLDGYDDSGE